MFSITDVIPPHKSTGNPSSEKDFKAPGILSVSESNGYRCISMEEYTKSLATVSPTCAPDYVVECNLHEPLCVYSLVRLLEGKNTI